MKKNRTLLFLFIGLMILAGIFFWQINKQDTPSDQFVAPRVEATSTNLNDRFGINGTLPSLTTNAGRMSIAAGKMAEAHFGWTRHEFHYSSSMSFRFYDRAQNYIDSQGLKTLGVLVYPGNDRSVNDWKNYVRSVVGHYGGRIPAWEIMNEADNYLSASDYSNYLKEAHDIIKSINSNAIIVSTGLSSRPEAADYLDGIKAAGGWDKFDVVGFHIYHNGSPEQVNWSVGSLSNEVSRIVGSINRNGGGKNIWITEMGYQSGSVGEAKQGQYLARAAAMARSFPAVDKIFFYRLYDNSDQSYGLLRSNMTAKESFATIKEFVGQINGKSSGEKIFTSYDVLDDNDPVPSGWYSGETTNASLILGGNWGYSGMGLTMQYWFDMGADKAYTMAEKELGNANAPVAIGAWIKGDNSKNFWKFRIEDAEDETFQIDFGSLSSDWQHVQFVLGQDPAITRWGGNGQIDYPIHFHIVVFVRLGGQESGEAWIDKIGLLPDIDTYAYKFGDFVMYWKVSGNGRYNICGHDLDFNETPQYISGC